MLKKAFGLLLTFLLIFGLALPAFSASVDYYDYYKNIKLTIGNNQAYINEEPMFVEQAPYVKSGCTLVPLRFIVEVLNASVEWQPATRTVIIEMQDGTIIKVVVGSKTAYVKNAAKILEVPAEIKGGRTFVPLRFISEAIGGQVGYNSTTKTVAVTLIDTSEWEEYVEPVTGIEVLFPGDWTVDSEGNSLIIQSDGETVFEFTFDDREQSQILRANKDKLVSEGWKVASETGAVIQLTKAHPYYSNSILTYIISTKKTTGGYLVSYVETNTTAREQDLAIIDKITPGDGLI